MEKKVVDGVTVEASNIITALKIIRTVCDDNICCNKCPLSNGARCLITERSPSGWEVNEPAKPWKALLP